jgi:hypothetical protein
MSITNIKSAFRFIVNIAPEYNPIPAVGTVIAAQGFTGTYAGAECDSFGVEWHSIVSAFEQRHFPSDQFVWALVYGEVQS